ncbi:MAG: hypothetical protein U1E05_23100, partial [Patescibacteria group bacterium]|nr:hypothetical protein [Patescibacteria group bacterium]
AALRELLILDDAGQYACQTGDRWRLISVPARFPTLGQKRNAAASLVSPDVDALAVWDDDDVYLPWALRASADALRHAAWSRPSVVLHPNRDGTLRQHLTGGLFHGGWSYRRAAFEAVGGYPPEMNNGEDQGFAARLKAAGAIEADPICLGFQPFYVYRWGTAPGVTAGGWHLSGLGPAGYEKLAARARLQAGRRNAPLPIQIAPPTDINLARPRIIPGVNPRVF